MYNDSYFLGEPLIVSGEPEIGTISVEGEGTALLRLTDIYNNTYWTPAV